MTDNDKRYLAGEVKANRSLEFKSPADPDKQDDRTVSVLYPLACGQTSVRLRQSHVHPAHADEPVGFEVSCLPGTVTATSGSASQVFDLAPTLT